MTDWIEVTPLVDTPGQREYWEPWTPKVGDRVRIRLSGECNRDWRAEYPASVPFPGHPDELNGRLGIVVPENRPGVFPHHPLAVEFDGEPVVINGIVYQQTRLAACELEPA